MLCQYTQSRIEFHNTRLRINVRNTRSRMKLLADMLEGMGHEVCATENTQAGAIAAAARHKADLLIVDAGLIEGEWRHRSRGGNARRFHPACVCERRRTR